MNNYYLVDYHYVGDYVDLKICESTLEIFSDEARLTTHRLFKSYQSNQYSTHECDLPENKSFTPWNTNRIINWANNSMDRVERSRELALKAGRYSPRYKQLEPILRTKQDKIAIGTSEKLNHIEPSGYVRGSDF